MNFTVYLETSIFSYLTARPSANVRSEANRESTIEWWSRRRQSFDLYISQFVEIEAAYGDATAAASRLKVISGLRRLDITPQAHALAQTLIQAGSIPAKAEIDAFHIAVAAVHGIDYLLTWNCTHIANAAMRAKIEKACVDSGYDPPILCTPLELMEA